MKNKIKIILGLFSSVLIISLVIIIYMVFTNNVVLADNSEDSQHKCTGFFKACNEYCHNELEPEKCLNGCENDYRSCLLDGYECNNDDASDCYKCCIGLENICKDELGGEYGGLGGYDYDKICSKLRKECVDAKCK